MLTRDDNIHSTLCVCALGCVCACVCVQESLAATKADMTRLRAQLDALQQKYVRTTHNTSCSGVFAVLLMLHMSHCQYHSSHEEHTLTHTHTHSHSPTHIRAHREEALSSQLKAESEKYASLRDKYEEANQNWLAERTVLTKQVGYCCVGGVTEEDIESVSVCLSVCLCEGEGGVEA